MFGLLVLLAGFGYCLLLYVCLRLMLWFASCLLLAFTGGCVAGSDWFVGYGDCIV